MKTVHTFLFSTLVLLSLPLCAYAQAAAPPAAPARPDYGALDGSVYTNRHFGLALTLPEG